MDWETGRPGDKGRRRKRLRRKAWAEAESKTDWRLTTSRDVVATGDWRRTQRGGGRRSPGTQWWLRDVTVS
jgi:hypothetical protein